MKFEAALAELENLVHSMEDGKLELEASIAAYRRGMELMKHCQAQLADAEQQIRILENGQFRDVDRALKEVPLGYNSLEGQ
jgi:exodeoxyribonuclease VII small subunit